MIGGEKRAWWIVQNWDEFASVARAYLASDPERNTLPLSVLDGVLAGRFREGPPVFGWHPIASSLDGAFIMTPPHELILVSDADGATSLGEQLRAANFPVPGVNAEDDVARRFTAAYLRTASAVSERRRMLLYRLDELVPPPIAAEGAPRIAQEADLELCLSFVHAMRAEVHEDVVGDQSDFVRRRICEGLVLLWVFDGRAVSLAIRTPESSSVTRIGPVYTPPEWRRRGFASAVTHACALAAVESGIAGVVLFTDVANPTSNAIYQTIGFRQIADRVVLGFGDPRAHRAGG